MSKVQFVMKSEVTFEVDEHLIDNVFTFKQAMDNGGLRVMEFNVDLVKEDGEKYGNSKDLEALKEAIIYGLSERL